MENDKIVITIMSDYSAFGLWENGACIDADYLYEDLNFSKEFVDTVSGPLEDWQNMYEGFNLYTSREETQKVYDSKDFKAFEELGEQIFSKFLALEQDEYIIEYFDERTSERRRKGKINE